MPLRGTESCCFCNIKENLLIKCQHPGCSVYCHPVCYLRQSNYCSFQVFLDGSSVSLLFFCSNHEQDVAKLNSDHSKECLCKSLRSLLSRPLPTDSECECLKASTQKTVDAIPQDPNHTSCYQLYPHLENAVHGVAELYPYQWSSLYFTKRKLERTSSKQNVIISERKMKRLCAICNVPLKAEIFPRLLSRKLICQQCGVQVHAFCEWTNGNKWRCVHCEDPQAVCKFCGQGQSFLARVPFENSFMICHYGCALMDEDISPRDDSLICEICGKGRYVLKCSHSGCKRTSHVYCGSGLFFVSPSHHLHYLCCNHLMDVLFFFNDSFSVVASPLLESFSDLRHCFSVGKVHIYNNTKAYNKLYEVFSSMGLPNPLHTKLEGTIETEESQKRIEMKHPQSKLKKKDS